MRPKLLFLLLFLSITLVFSLTIPQAYAQYEEQDYVDQTSNVDEAADIGTHSSFAAMQAGPDSTFDILTEGGGGAGGTFIARTETYVNVASLTGAFDITVTKPTGTTNGDILFCHIAWYAATTIDSVPSGWNLIGSYTANTDRYALYYKIASSEPASWVWSFAATAKVRAVCSSYYGTAYLGGASPIDVSSNTAYRTNNNQVVAASMTVATTNSPLLFWGCVYSTASKTFTPPTVPGTWTEDDDAGSTTPDFWTEVCSLIWSGSGATGNIAATCSSSLTAKHAFAVALKPALTYLLDLEVQWANAEYSRTYEELCIYAGNLNAEALRVDVWMGSWTNIIASLSANQWNNVSVSSYLTGSTFTIRFVDGTPTNDLSQSTWQIDCVLLHTWSEPPPSEYERTASFTVAISCSFEKIGDFLRTANYLVNIMPSFSGFAEFFRTAFYSITTSLNMIGVAIMEFERSASFAIALSLGITKLGEFERTSNYYVGVSQSTSPLSEFLRSISYTVAISASTSKLSEFLRRSDYDVAVDLATSKTAFYGRATNYSITMSISSLKIAEFNRESEYSLSVTSSTSKLSEFVRNTAYTLTVSYSALKLSEFIRVSTYSLNIGISSFKIRSLERSAIYSITTNIGVSKNRELLRNIGYTIKVGVISSKRSEFLRGSSFSFNVFFSLPPKNPNPPPDGIGEPPPTENPPSNEKTSPPPSGVLPETPRIVAILDVMVQSVLFHNVLWNQAPSFQVYIINKDVFSGDVLFTYTIRDSATNQIVTSGSKTLFLESGTAKTILITLVPLPDGKYYIEIKAEPPAYAVSHADLTVTSPFYGQTWFLITLAAIAVVVLIAYKKTR